MTKDTTTKKQMVTSSLTYFTEGIHRLLNILQVDRSLIDTHFDGIVHYALDADQYLHGNIYLGVAWCTNGQMADGILFLFPEWCHDDALAILRHVSDVY